MDYRPLGRTGVQVSKLCLGTMMFGAWGNQDHDDSVRIIRRALDAGINFIDSADIYSAVRAPGERQRRGRWAQSHHALTGCQDIGVRATEPCRQIDRFHLDHPGHGRRAERVVAEQ